jgi:CheY-like chemotaxis protein
VSRWILLAEDNEDDLALALRVIRKLDPEIRIVTARDGEEAVDVVANCPEDDIPALILLDMKMPRRSGLEALREIRKIPHFQCVPLVMLTSSDEPTDLASCYANGANSYTVKPIDFDEFSRQMASTIDYWMRINRLPVKSSMRVGC